MNKTLSIAMALLSTTLVAGPAAGQGNRPPPPPAPDPGSPAIFRSNAEMMEALESSKAEGRPLASSSIAVTDQYRGAFVHRNQPNTPIAHSGNTELHYIVEGSGIVETGGTIVRPDDAPATIEGGESRSVVPGDIIIIPPGSPHRYSQVDEPITYLEWRWVAPE